MRFLLSLINFKKINNMYRQGDVLLIPINEAGEGKTLEPLTLAKGEKSGHHHNLYGGAIDKDGILVVAEQAELRHEKVFEEKTGGKYPIADHQPIVIPKGMYKVVIQRQLNPFSNTETKIETVWD
jgi:hypothetical protein